MLPAETEAMLSCRSSGVWVRGVWRYHRTRTQPLPPGTRRSGQLDPWRILQTASPHRLLPGKEIKLSMSPTSRDSRDGNPALLCLELPLEQNKWEIHPVLSLGGCFCQGSSGGLLTLCGHPSPWGAEKLKCAGTSGWILVSKGDFTGWLFCMPSSFFSRDHSY